MSGNLVIMAEELKEAAEKNNIEFIQKYTEDDYEFISRKTHELDNIMHLAIRNESWGFAEEAMSKFPKLVWEKNNDDNTPLHLAAEKGHCGIATKVCETLSDRRSLRAQNTAGNTPLHVAVAHRQFQFACILAEKDTNSGSVLNENREAPIHLVLKHFPLVDNSSSYYQERKREQQRFTQLMEEKQRTTYGVDDHEEDVTPVLDHVAVLIRLLLTEANYVAGLQDADGLTPLHLAATKLPQSYNLAVAKYIIERWPGSVEVSDYSDKTILHHLVGKKIGCVQEGLHFLHYTSVKNLINKQDGELNTPAHVAATNSDIVILRLLRHFHLTDWEIENKEGKTPTSLLKKEGHSAKATAVEKSKMRKIYKAAKYADVFSLKSHIRKETDDLLWSPDSDGENIVHKIFQIKSHHVIVPQAFLDFIEKQLGKDIMPLLLRGTNKVGDTPFHILAKLDTDNILINLAKERCVPTPTRNKFPGGIPKYSAYFGPGYMCYKYFWVPLGNEMITIIMDVSLKYFDREGFTKNVQGNTALHEALICKNYRVFRRLAEFDGGATALANERKETLLHLLASLNPIPEVAEEVINSIILNNTREEQHFYNIDGLSALMLAVRAGNMEFAAKLCTLCPKLAECRDPKGRTFWHQLVDLPRIESFDFANSSFANEVVRHQLETKDNDGKTALHLAFEDSRFDLAQTFLGLGGELTSEGIPTFQERLLEIPNGDITPFNMIAEFPTLPREFEEFIKREHTLVGIRSIWGVPSKQLESCANMMMTIAGFLATMTITLSFTVPGGLDRGTPTLMKSKSFQIFFITNMVVMGLSLMALYCSFRCRSTGNKSKSLKSLDLSILLVAASFHIVPVSIMAGIYSTTNAVKLWVAIVALAMFIVVIVLVYHSLVSKLFISSSGAVQTAYRHVKESCKKFFPRSHNNSTRLPTARASP